MKTLLVIRHAKSSWKDPSLSDLQRPLKKRGMEDALDMGQRLKDREVVVDRVLCSPASRAVQTMELMGEIIAPWREMADQAPDLYGFDYEDLMLAVRRLEDQWRRVAIIGHNPGITDLVNFLALENLRNIPTCGIAELALDIESWADLKVGCAELLHYDYPKSRSE